MKLLDILKLTDEEKDHGVWLSGKEGEYKEWYRNGQLCEQSFYKNGIKDRECKWWDEDGNLVYHFLYEKGDLKKDCLKE